MHDHWVPKWKYELVTALSKKWPEDRKKFKKMRRDQLYAIWFRLWADAGHNCCRRPVI